MLGPYVSAMISQILQSSDGKSNPSIHHDDIFLNWIMPRGRVEIHFYDMSLGDENGNGAIDERGWREVGIPEKGARETAGFRIELPHFFSFSIFLYI